jgi:cytochrome c-type biogenesis protein CcmH
MKLKRMIPLLVIVSIALSTTSVAQAQDPTPQPPVTDNEVNAVAEDMFCPVCENIPLDVCGTVACQQWRDEIRQKLAEGWTEDEIQDFFVMRYGDRVLAEPPRRGFNWLIYLVPPVLIVLAAFLLYRGLQSWRKPLSQPLAVQAEAGADGDQQQDDYVSRLEAELKDRT